MPLKIVADENIPFVASAFAGVGQVRLIAGRELDASAVKDADVLLVRSVTPVNEQLLDGSRVRFVATATIGTDHVDEVYLKSRNIGFASAPGSNSNSVAEYVVAALLVLADRFGWRLDQKAIGVVGVGNVGSKVAAKCRGLGLCVLENDPPLQQATGEPRFIELDELLQQSDIVSVHVPLTKASRYATYHMIDQQFIDRLRSGALVVNTSRGAVADTQSLKAALRSGRLHAVLDVWEGEPAIDAELAAQVDLGTAHIAGYSLDGKINGLWMIYEAVCKYFGIEPSWRASSVLPPPAVPCIELDCRSGDEQALILEAVRQVYDIEADHAALRRIVDVAEHDRGAYFDTLRKTYRVRREFFNTTVRAEGGEASLLEKLAALGFKISQD